MRKRKPGGMETEPEGRQPLRWWLRGSIETVAHNRHAQPGQMHAELVGSARDRLQLQTRPPPLGRGRCREQPPPCRRGPSEDRIDAGSRRPLRIRRQRQVHDSFGVNRPAVHDRLVPLLHHPRLECPAQRGPRLARTGQHEKARCVAVEPMHRLEVAEGSTQVRRDTGRIERCPRRHARHARRLVDHDQISVGKDDADAAPGGQSIEPRRSRFTAW